MLSSNYCNNGGIYTCTHMKVYTTLTYDTDQITVFVSVTCLTFMQLMCSSCPMHCHISRISYLPLPKLIGLLVRIKKGGGGRERKGALHPVLSVSPIG